MRVLFIEDDETLRRNVTTIFRERGHEVAWVTDFDDLKAAGQEAEFDLLVVDVQTDSFDVLSFLKGLNDSKKLLGGAQATLLLGAADDLMPMIHGLGFRLNDYVADPFDRRAILSALARLEATFQTQSTKAPAAGVAIEDTGSDNALRRQAAGSEQVATPPDRARIIAVASHKGGTGKTTIAMHLISGFLQQGLRVAAIDLDRPQLSLSRYLDNRRVYIEKHSLDLPLPHHRAPKDPESDLSNFRNGLINSSRPFDVVLIDCPAGSSETTPIVLSVADSLITPINDSFMDLDLLAVLESKTLAFRRPGTFGEKVIEARNRRRVTGDGDLEWIVLRNRLTNLNANNKALMADSLAQLAPHLGFRLGEGLSERVIYRNFFLEGLTLLDLRTQGVEQRLSLSQVAARQEMRSLMAMFDTQRDDARTTRADAHPFLSAGNTA